MYVYYVYIYMYIMYIYIYMYNPYMPRVYMAMGRLWMKSYSWTSFSVNHPSTIQRLQTWTVIAQPRGQGALGLSAPTVCSYRSCSFA